MPDFSFGEILTALGPTVGPGTGGITLLLNGLIYIIFVLMFIAFFMQDDKQLSATLLVGATLAMLMIAKLTILDPEELPMLIINAGIFVTPLFVTGMSKAKKSKPLTIIAGVLGGVYFFSYWFFIQRLA